jgi:hypothetical protein
MRSVFGLFAVTVGACFAGVALGCAAGATEPEMQMMPATPEHTSAPELGTASEFCTARAGNECSTAIVSACGLSSKGSCVNARTKTCMSSIPQGTTYQPKKAEACLDVVKSVYATNTITAIALASLDPACTTALFAGPGAARAPCMTDYDCDSAKGLACVPPPPNTSASDPMSQCFVPQAVAPGGDCSEPGTVCGMGTYCSSTGLTCVMDNQLNDPCSLPYYPCAAGLQCNGVGPFATCGMAEVDGSACQADTACNSGLCDKATDQADGTCASTVTLTSLDSMCADFQ